MIRNIVVLSICLALTITNTAMVYAQDMPATLTPPASPSPRINGPAVFGVRPGSPVIYSIPATGTRPMKFEVENLPKQLKVDAATGLITGTLKTRGEYAVVLKATNKLGSAEKKFRIIVGDHIALTPPMGWSSWNAFGETITQEKIANIARAMVKSGLSQHGFTYINMDDGWQGKRTGKYMGLQGNEKFPDMGALVDTIHKLGLKAGIYSTPWETSYAKFPGGSAETARRMEKDWQQIWGYIICQKRCPAVGCLGH